MLDVLRFWFDRGVDGFRVDAIHHLIEDEWLRDNPPNPEWRPGSSPARAVIRVHTMDQPEVHDAITAMRRIADGYPDRVMIGEAYLPIERLMAYYGRDLSGFQLPFNFHLLSTAWTPQAIAELVETYEAALPPGGWPNWVLGNHDRSRLVSRLGAAQARVAAMLLLTLRGTPTIYQGEEIGMRDVPIPLERVQDPWERNVPDLGLGRDPVRTPLRWEAGPGAGFTAGDPWLPVGDEDTDLTVAAQSRDPRSLFALYQALLRLRRCEQALSVGSISAVSARGDILTFEREWGGRKLAVALNFGGATETVILPRPSRTLLTSLADIDVATSENELRLRPHEAIIVAYA